MYKTDLKKAGELLDAAGWKLPAGKTIREASGVAGVADGTPLRIRYNVLHHKEIGEVLQQQLRKAGIDLAVEVVPGPVQIERVRNRDFELMYERQRSPDPAILDQVWNSKWDQPGGWAWTGFKDAKLDETVGKLRSLPDFARPLRGREGGAEDHHGKRAHAADPQRPGVRRLSHGQGEGLPDGVGRQLVLRQQHDRCEVIVATGAGCRPAPSSIERAMSRYLVSRVDAARPGAVHHLARRASRSCTFCRAIRRS